MLACLLIIGPLSGLATELAAQVPPVCSGGVPGGQCALPPDLEGLQQLDCGATHVLALDAAGRLQAWGSNQAGQLDVPPGLLE
ncbi:MAG: RCC1 domain-containing protein, partial [Planctomycetota bacterium]|nr:RCC1 domain-containing protein [Planctomycetota bacterium]